jgi:hypothetical protein
MAISHGLTSGEIDNMLGIDRNYGGVLLADQLPDPITVPPSRFFIVNYSTSMANTPAKWLLEHQQYNDGGTHWVMIRAAGIKPPEYYDSFGFRPGDNAVLLKVPPVDWERWLNINAKRHGHETYVSNSIENQCSKQVSCGYYAILAAKYGLPQDPKTGEIRGSVWKALWAVKNICSKSDMILRKVLSLKHVVSEP